MATPTIEASNSTSKVAEQDETVLVSLTLTSAKILMVGVEVGSLSVDPITAAIVNVRWNTSEAVDKVVASESDDGHFEGVCWFRLDNPTAGSFNVGVKVAGFPGIQIGVHAIALLESGITVRAPSINNGTSTSPSVVEAASASDDLVLAIVASDDEGGITGRNGTLVGTDTVVNSDSAFGCQSKVAAGANTSMTWTTGGTSNKWATSAISFEAPSGGGGGQVPRSMHIFNQMRA